MVLTDHLDTALLKLGSQASRLGELGRADPAADESVRVSVEFSRGRVCQLTE